MRKDVLRDFDSSHCSCAAPLTFGSLFAGIGGIDLGFERAGMVCKWQVEIDDYARRVLEKHWPDVRRHDDVRTWPQPDTGYVDIIAGGFPCQDVSAAGKRVGINGERSGLWFEMLRVVRQLRPRIVVVENVAGLLDRGAGEVYGSLAEIGFDARGEVLSSCMFGASHARERVFLVARTDSEPWRRQRWWQRFTGESPQEWDVCEREIEPRVARMADGIPNRLDRCEKLGNAVDPRVAEWIGRRIVEASKDVD
jgi:DNA (cytosine-5)-methyltransferase 1